MEVSANVLVIAYNCLFQRACCTHHIDTDFREIPFSKATGFPCNMKQQLCRLTKVETEYRSKFLPTLGSIPPDPTKTLDGSGSWYDDTMRDGITICQDGVNALYLELRDRCHRSSKNKSVP